ncbi:MAG: glycerophosphodiester phosphodiesterase [Clostridiaceae bacterium]|nr:glycerophosphodiester phosphodiesterase [Clostridiaceae bacterium]
MHDMVIAGFFVLLFILLILYFIKPNSKRFKGFPMPFFAHRGLHGDGIPENSIAAFRKARQKGLGVELDVRLTLDNKLVVFHDDDLKRLCGEPYSVEQLKYDDLKKFSLSGTEEKIPLFEEVLKVLEGMPVICEIKSLPGDAVGEVCEAVCRHIAEYNGFVCIESFNPYVVQWFAKNRPDLIRGQLSMNFMPTKKALPVIQAFLMTNLLVNVLGRPDFIAYRHTDDSVGFFLCRKIFKPVCAAWTICSEKEKKAANLKYQAIIFEKFHPSHDDLSNARGV